MSSLLPNVVPVTSHFSQCIMPLNALLLHSFTSLKVGACRYTVHVILQKMKIHIL